MDVGKDEIKIRMAVAWLIDVSGIAPPLTREPNENGPCCATHHVRGEVGVP